MDESTGTVVHHLLLLCLQIAILISLSIPYLAAHRAGQLRDYIAGESWNFGDFLGSFSALCLFVFHLFLWTQEPIFPSELAPKILAIFYGWTAMLTVWVLYCHKRSKNAAQQHTEV